ncbi:MAG: PEGA domain-containing protein [Candidatus Zixiibacteriota bacterium]
MRKSILVLLFILVSTYFWGCGTTRIQTPIIQKPTIEGHLDKNLEGIADSLLSQVFTENKSYRTYFIDVFAQDGRPSDLEEHITQTLRDILSTNTFDGKPKVKLRLRDATRENMSIHDLRATASDIYKNADIWANLGTDIVMLGYWTKVDEESIKIAVEVCDIRKHGERICGISKEILKDDQIRKLMGEKFPGTLFVKSPDHDARVLCDLEDKGQVGKKGLLIDVPYGNHFVQVEKEGYKPFAKSIWMPERGSEGLKVKFTSPSGAPLSAFLVNAIVPMSATWTYGRRMDSKKGSIAFNTISAGLFYVSGSLFLIDHFGGHKSKGDYLTEGNYDTYRKVKKVELYCTLGFYALNLISGIVVGVDYQNSNRKGVEITNENVGYANPDYRKARNSPNMIWIKFSF